ncbi:F-box domain-containing protein [Mycena sanguinolenta]|uniref:F-box domain-containing protein n=1 Tax=Mycena sanguinolenta TaxID=230812 RepID=A0A8H7CZ63_9AGAR|nr:F-box domain-containing protein [Mycena sanguinolenta]
MERNRDRLISIASHPKIPSMIQSWSFHAATPRLLTEDVMVRRYPAFQQILGLSRAISSEFRSTIGAYTNLSELDLTGFQLTPGFAQTIASLPKLATIALTDCDVHCPASFRGIALEAFTCGCKVLQLKDDMAEQYNLVSGSNLKVLELFDPASGRAFVTALAPAPLPHLAHLNVHLGYGDKDLFYRFLDCCPALKCIILEAPPTFADGITLPETTVPVLHSYTGPIEIAGVFAGGRPIHMLKLHRWLGGDDDDEVTANAAVVQQVLLEISTSSATIEDLTLPTLSLDSAPLRLVASFPKLKYLMFILPNTRGDEEHQSDGESDSEGDWETANGSSSIGSADEIIDIEGDGNDPSHLDDWETPWMTLNDLGDFVLGAKGVVLDSEEGRCGDCSSECSTQSECSSECSSDTSESIDWSGAPANEKIYEDLKLKSIEDFILALGNDLIPLPRNIRELYIGTLPIIFPGSKEMSMPDSEMSFVVEKLGSRYPGLKKVVVGFQPRTWKRKNGFWKYPKPETATPVHPLQRLLQLGSLAMA